MSEMPLHRQEQELPPVTLQQGSPRHQGTQLRAVRTVPYWLSDSNCMHSMCSKYHIFCYKTIMSHVIPKEIHVHTTTKIPVDRILHLCRRSGIIWSLISLSLTLFYLTHKRSPNIEWLLVGVQVTSNPLAPSLLQINAALSVVGGAQLAAPKSMSPKVNGRSQGR